MNEDKVLIIPLFGLPCHLCARPGQWFVDGGTLPCKCGFLDVQALADAVDAVRRYTEIKAAVQARANLHRRSAAKFGAKFAPTVGRPKSTAAPLSRKRAA